MLQALLDLMGDEASAASSSASAGVSTQTTHDLLADIFGGSNAPAATEQPTAANTAVNDIMGLFGDSSAPTVTSPTLPAGNMASLFDVSDAPSSAPAPVPAGPTQYPAYAANGLKITLAPQKDAQNPNVVNILATFTATGGSVQGINFQAAVPKVGCLLASHQSS